MSASPELPARLNLRLAPEHKALIERAAAALGVTLSDFVIAELVRCAQRTLDENVTTRLSDEESRAFLRLLAAPPEPVPSLRDAARKFTARASPGASKSRKQRRV